MVQFGCCLPGGSFMPEGVAAVPQSPADSLVAKCRYILETGFDFTEVAGGMLVGLDDAGWRMVLSENEKSSLGLYAANSLFPKELKMGDPTADRDAQKAYIQKLVDRFVPLGIRYAVFGSGVARSIPDGVSRADGIAALRRFMGDFADCAYSRGVTLVIEPLRKKETNVYVTVPETAAEVRTLANPGIQLLCDAFHMAEEGTPADAVLAAGELIRHCHMAEAPDRTCPGKYTTGDPQYNRDFARCLNQIGYTGGVSAECGFDDFRTDVPQILAYLREIFA